MKIKLSFFLFLFIWIFLLLFLINNFFHPAYLSVKSDCGLISEVELNSQGYFTAGEYVPSNDTITIYYDVPEVNKHENCHKVQAYRGVEWRCDRMISLFLSEFECYVAQDLPDEIYERFYPID